MTVQDFIEKLEASWEVHIDILDKHGKMLMSDGLHMLYLMGKGLLKDSPYWTAKILKIHPYQEQDSDIITIAITIDYF